MRTAAPGVALGLLFGSACFAENSVYDDCDRENCGVDTGADHGTSTNAPLESTSLPADVTTTLGEGDPASSGEPATTAESSTTSAADTSSSSADSGAGRCGDRLVDPAEQCDDGDDDAYDGCDACQAAPMLGAQFVDHYGPGDEVLALAPDDDHVLVSAFVDGELSADDAVWLRLDDGGTIDPASWFSLADLPDRNRVLDIARRDDLCVLGGFVDGTLGAATARANTVDCVTGQFSAFLSFEPAEDVGLEQMSTVVILGDGGIVVGGRRMRESALRGWIATLDPSGQLTQSTVWLDDPSLFGDHSEVLALSLAADDTVFVAGSYHDIGFDHGFAAPLALVATAPTMFAVGETASVAADVEPLPTGMAVVGWSSSALGDDDARIELFDGGGGAPTVWQLAELDDERLHAITITATGLVAVGWTTGADSDEDLLSVWLDHDLVEQHRVVWDSGAGSDLARDVVADEVGVTIGGHIGNADGGTDLLVQRWSLP